VVEYLKKGDAELAIAAEIPEDWERLDKWPLFTERFQIVVNRNHTMASKPVMDLEALRGQRVLQRSYCENRDQLTDAIQKYGLAIERGDEVTSERDALALIEGNFGIAFLPRSTPTPASLAAAPIEGIDFNRTVYVYGVAGRQRTPVASTILKMLRASDWSRFVN
jgi:DNA-binding transcriptional LysR family regulator